MKYPQRKTSENTDNFEIGLKIQNSPTVRRESKFQTFPQIKPQNIFTLKLLKFESQLSNVLFNYFIHENKMRINN